MDYQEDIEALDKVYPIEQHAAQTIYKKNPLPLAKSMQESYTYSRLIERVLKFNLLLRMFFLEGFRDIFKFYLIFSEIL